MKDVDELGMAVIASMVLDIISPDSLRGDDGTAHPYAVSIDVDGFDSSIAPGVGTPVLGGLTYREGRLLCEKLCSLHAPCKGHSRRLTRQLTHHDSYSDITSACPV